MSHEQAARSKRVRAGVTGRGRFHTWRHVRIPGGIAPAGPMSSRGHCGVKAGEVLPQKALDSGLQADQPAESERERERELGPLYTRAKSRDHEIVRAQKKVSKRPLSQPTSKLM
jgi:hypothetical protein